VITRYAIVLIRLYLGAWMLLNGLNHFVALFPQPLGGPDRSSQLLVTLIETGLFALVKSTEIAVGVMLLLDLFVPLALVVAMPVSVVVWYNHAILVGRPFDFSMGIGCLVWNLLLLVAYFPHFLPLLRVRAASATRGDFNRLGERWSSQGNPGDVPELKHHLPIALAGIALTAVLAYHLHPDTAQNPGAGLTPATLVAAYLQLAYANGKPDEAQEMYVSAELAGRDKTLVLTTEGRPRVDKVLKTVAQGSTVVAYQRISGPPGASDLDVVDIFKIAKSRISEHFRVSQHAGPSEP
jgi:uncharacterized membrane protein YphA (DoxX/SURF4 family)